MTACHQDKTINVFSKDIKDPKEKKETLKKYLKKQSGVQDSEYHIWFMDNGGGRVPGPSDYNITLALKIETDSINNWVGYLEPTKPFKIDDWDVLKLNPKIWNLKGEVNYYRSSIGYELKIVFKEQNIVLAKYSTMPIKIKYVE